ncbi:MAG: tetratricopeptide repeat protein [Caulobacteraceae bacterium]
MVDLFDEVEEELRSDRYRNLLRTLIPWVTGIFAAVLLGYLAFWGYTAWQDRNLAGGALAYQKGVDALSTGDTATALTSFEAAKQAGAPGYKTLALMEQGNLRAELNKPDEAAKLFDQAADAAPNQILGDLARLKAAQVLLDTAPLPQLTTRLTPLMDGKRPYAIFARETLAMAKLMAGKNDAAKSDFQVIQVSLLAPEDMRQRAQLAIALIDSGEAATAVSAVKTAATMPPPPASMVGAPPPATQAPDAAQSPPAGAAQ